MKSPTGKSLVGVREVLSSVAAIDCAALRSGKLTFQYDGGTDVDWNSQRPARRKGGHQFIDEAGEAWSEEEIIRHNTVTIPTLKALRIVETRLKKLLQGEPVTDKALHTALHNVQVAIGLRQPTT